jgi:beta-xylosidase
VTASVLTALGVTGASASTAPLALPVPLPVAPVALPDPAVVITPGTDVPDPFVFQDAGIYYMFASQENFFGPNVPLMVSATLTSWGPPVLDALPKLPQWAAPGFTWSPDVRRLGGHYVMWFNASVAGTPFDGPKCIGVATAASVIGPYTSIATAPLVCQLDHLGSIDPRTFVDAQGRLWLLWKSDDNADLAASTHSIIWVQQLAPDGLSLLGSPTALVTADLPWEGRIVESPDMVYVGGLYWLFLSGNWFNQPAYAIGLEQCAGPSGPCQAASTLPWLGSNAEGTGPGEESLFYDGARWWMLYAPSAVNYRDPTPRPAALARLTVAPAGPAVVAPGTPAWDQAPDPPPPRRAPSCPNHRFGEACGPGPIR